jgi:hypothetical protein
MFSGAKNAACRPEKSAATQLRRLLQRDKEPVAIEKSNRLQIERPLRLERVIPLGKRHLRHTIAAHLAR